MSKIHPQKRIQSVMISMLESRRRSEARADADDWIERGWNPFLTQKGNYRGDPTAFETMVDAGTWSDWFDKHNDKWSALAKEAFPLTSKGQLDGGELIALAAKRAWRPSEWSTDDYRTDLERLLQLGLDPNGSKNFRLMKSQSSAIFGATRYGAELLANAGVDFSGRGLMREGCWEHWAARVMSSRITLDDLDWLAERCPPSWTGSGGVLIGFLAIKANAVPIAKRLIDAGSGVSAFGMDTPAGITNALNHLTVHADSSDMLEILAPLVGWDKIIQSFLADENKRAPIRSVLFFGRVKCLNVLESHGLLAPGGTTAEELTVVGAECWAKGSMTPQRMTSSSTTHDDWKPDGIHLSLSGPQASGLAWAMRRLPVSKIALAASTLDLCVHSHPAETARLVQTCASKGLLPDSGLGSVSDLYNDGQLWKGEVGRGGKEVNFAAFTALCEDKSLKKAIKPKTKTKTSKTSAPKLRL